jgi:hypothetical protein
MCLDKVGGKIQPVRTYNICVMASHSVIPRTSRACAISTMASADTSSSPLAVVAVYMALAICTNDGRGFGAYASARATHIPECEITGVRWTPGGTMPALAPALGVSAPLSALARRRFPLSTSAVLVPINLPCAALHRDRTSLDRVICSTRLSALSFSTYTPACFELDFRNVNGWTASEIDDNWSVVAL